MQEVSTHVRHKRRVALLLADVGPLEAAQPRVALDVIETLAVTFPTKTLLRVALEELWKKRARRVS